MPTEVDSGMVMGKAAPAVSYCYLRMRMQMDILTVAGYVLDEDLHRGFRLSGGSAGSDGGDGGDAVGTHIGGSGGSRYGDGLDGDSG